MMDEQPTERRPRRLWDYASSQSPGASAVAPLPDAPTGPLPVSPILPTRTWTTHELHAVPGADTPTSATIPLVIAGDRRSRRWSSWRQRPRPLVMHLTVIVLIVCAGLGTLYSVVPIGGAAPHFAAFASLQSVLDFAVPPGPRNVRTMTYKVQARDTLASIAAKFHTSVDVILGLNQLTAGDDLYVGEVLRVPAPPTPTPVIVTQPVYSAPAYQPYIPPNGDASRAIAWAEAQLGSQAWDLHCELFVENAYGTSNRYLTAQDSYYALHTSDSWTPDIGALVWFAPNAGNQWDGHVGIYIGQGNFISATTGGVAINSLAYWNRYVAPYEGWGNPPPWW